MLWLVTCWGEDSYAQRIDDKPCPTITSAGMTEPAVRAAANLVSNQEKTRR